jgi:hypothetical protein
MFRHVVLFACLAACGGVDDRPKNLEYITGAILIPTCSAAQCHSQFRQWAGDEFDTTTAARRSLIDYRHVIPQNSCLPYPQVCDATLIISVTKGLQSVVDPSYGIVRMPYDAPLPNVDVALIQDWIAEGVDKTNTTTNGEGPIGAQCVPEENSGNACALDGNVHACTPEGNIGGLVKACTSACANGACP